MVAALDRTVERIGTGRVGQGFQLVEGPVRFFGIVVAEDRTDEDGPLAFGSRRVSAIRGGTRGGQVTSFLSRSTPS